MAWPMLSSWAEALPSCSTKTGIKVGSTARFGWRSAQALSRSPSGRSPAWAERQPNLAVDPTFIPVLVEQLGKASAQLESIGQAIGKPSLELDIADLVRWGQQQADERLKPPHN